MHHFVPIERADLAGSHALISDASQVDTAIVFVHGFLGDPTKTWLGFQTLVDQHRGWEDSDLFFLGHAGFSLGRTGGRAGGRAGRRGEAAQSIWDAAATLRSALRWIARRPPELRRSLVEDLPPWLARAAAPAVLGIGRGAYRKLILVGHSHGGLVLRTALLGIGRTHLETMGTGADAGAEALEAAPLELKAAVRLFAPALFGTRPDGLYGLFLTAGRTAWLARVVDGALPALEELAPGSTLQEAVRDGTETLAGLLDGLPSFRAEVLWADRDEVVIDREYLCDRNLGRAPGKDHAEVCRPSLAYPDPLELVRDGRP